MLVVLQRRCGREGGGRHLYATDDDRVTENSLLAKIFHLHVKFTNGQINVMPLTPDPPKGEWRAVSISVNLV
jgi:hypothetical protein